MFKMVTKKANRMKFVNYVSEAGLYGEPSGELLDRIMHRVHETSECTRRFNKEPYVVVSDTFTQVAAASYIVAVLGEEAASKMTDHSLSGWFPSIAADAREGDMYYEISEWVREARN